MDLSEVIFQLIVSFAFAGGFGYINYFILHGMGIVNLTEDNKDEKYFSLIICSVINIVLFYSINLILQFIINSFLSSDSVYEWYFIVLALLITLIVTIILSFTIFKWTIIKLYNLINNNRKKSNLAGISNKSVRTLIFDKGVVLFAYVYNLESSELLCHGCMGAQSEKKDGDFEFQIYPSDKAEKWDYNYAMQRAQKNVDSSLYINVDKKIKIIVIPEPEQ
jgi:hypothetical protein